MRAFVLALIVTCAAAWGGAAVGTAVPPPDLDVLWENPYEYDWMTYAFFCSGGHHTQDDFTFEESGVIMGFEGWFGYKTEHPKPFTATIRLDSGGNPGGILWTADITNVGDYYTGDSFWDQDVYRTLLTIDEEDYVSIGAGTTYWLDLYWTGLHPGYWLCEDIGNLYSLDEHYDFSAFFTILGSPESGVEPMSWGEIKATF